MAQTNVNIRMDEELKKQFDAFCSDIGMSMTTAICVFAKKAVRERRIPFEITADVPNAETLAAIDDVNNNRSMSKTYDDIDELMRDLNA
ncbi:MAG: type II toxin-antitoxin system RelB/DinJ family antitoxin [Lachnospiraceae bacterium]|nr:type II toxin-antitoxin system RelB/DinJ family antitoxin [Lachnospiraceae bacterium]